MAAIKRASEAREALADFSIGGGAPVPLPGLPPANRGGRPRLGDYMDFYRNKMAAGGTNPTGYVPPPHTGPYQQLPAVAGAAPYYGVHPGQATQIQTGHPGGYIAPPSPAPSSIPDSSTYPYQHFPEEHGRPSPMLQQHPYSQVSPMPATSYAAQAIAHNPALGLPAHLQGAQAPKLQTITPPPQSYAPQPQLPQSNHTHVPVSGQYPPGQFQQYPGSGVPTPAVATPISSVNAPAPVPSGQWNTSQQVSVKAETS
ncbi:unnamed protein product [Strongylus vulgaris]|uniref:Uncharacterized protein n=1 Tax=Strongylus vulgaris TaxID=40348 RepID=A0A3P7J1N4_STRVU|nr:unnamed protein product [Strongylus vulgaris]